MIYINIPQKSWPQAGGDPHRSGLFRGSIRSVTDQDSSIIMPMNGSILAPPVTDDGNRIYVADMQGWVSCFSRSGQRIWDLKLDSGVIAGLAFYEPKALLYVGTTSGTVYCIDAPTSHIRWYKELPSATDPRIVANLLLIGEEPTLPQIVVGSWGGYFWILNGLTGDEFYHWNGGLYPSSSPVLDHRGRIWAFRVVRNNGREIICIEKTRVERVVYKVDKEKDLAYRHWTFPSPVIDVKNKRGWFIVNLTNSSLIYVINVDSDSVINSIEWDATVSAAPALLPNGHLIIADMHGKIAIIGEEGPTVVKKLNEDYILAGILTDAEGKAVVATPSGRIYLVKQLDSNELVIEIIKTLPRAIIAPLAMISLGRVLVACTNHMLYCL